MPHHRITFAVVLIATAAFSMLVSLVVPVLPLIQQDLGTDQPGRVGGAGGSAIEGFIGAQGTGSGDYLQEPESASSAKATQGTDFAAEGRGAAEGEDDDASEGHPS